MIKYLQGIVSIVKCGEIGRKGPRRWLSYRSHRDRAKAQKSHFNLQESMSWIAAQKAEAASAKDFTSVVRCYKVPRRLEYRNEQLPRRLE